MFAPRIHTGESRRDAIGLPAHSAAELAGIGKRVSIQRECGFYVGDCGEYAAYSPHFVR
jgi:hypothetical protein